jgi:DCN1-like protein 1/2
MRYFGDINVDLEGLESFAAHEIVQAPAMGEMSREGFVNGWQERKYVLIYYTQVIMH